MTSPEAQQQWRNDADLYTEEATFYSAETTADGEPVRTYRVRRVYIRASHQWFYDVCMEVHTKQAAEDILGRKAVAGERTTALWEELWPRVSGEPCGLEC